MVKIYWSTSDGEVRSMILILSWLISWALSSLICIVLFVFTFDAELLNRYWNRFRGCSVFFAFVQYMLNSIYFFSLAPGLNIFHFNLCPYLPKSPFLLLLLLLLFFFFKLHFALAEESAPGSIWDFSLLQNFLFNHHVKHFGNCQKVCHLVYLGTCIVHAKKSQSLEHSGHKRLKICRKHKE